MTYAFDIDGTLIHHPGQPDWLSEASLAESEPIPDACHLVRCLILEGHRVHFITGRSHKVRAITLAQLRAYVHPNISDNHLTTQESFTGYEAMTDYKAAALKACKAVGYVGDHEADRAAAAKAKVPFLYAIEFQRGVAWA